MQSRIARHIDAIATRLKRTRGEKRKRRGEREGNGGSRVRRDYGDFVGATAWNHVATLHNIVPVISDRHLTHARSCVLSKVSEKRTRRARRMPLRLDFI